MQCIGKTIEWKSANNDCWLTFLFTPLAAHRYLGPSWPLKTPLVLLYPVYCSLLSYSLIFFNSLCSLNWDLAYSMIDFALAFLWLKYRLLLLLSTNGPTLGSIPPVLIIDWMWLKFVLMENFCGVTSEFSVSSGLMIVGARLLLRSSETGIYPMVPCICRGLCVTELLFSYRLLIDG